LDGLIGFRHLGLNESLTSEGHFSTLATLNPNLFPGFVPGETVSVTDRFKTTDRFYGGQIGLASECRRGRFFFDANFKLAMGNTRQTVIIDGDTVIANPAVPPT